MSRLSSANSGDGSGARRRLQTTMKVTRLELDGLLLIEIDVHGDERGFFVERFNIDRFRAQGLPADFVQDNHSRSRPGVVRGLHYQHTPAQGKLVGVTRGRIFDVVLDIRPDSPTYGQTESGELSDMNGRLLWIPSGFAHGFCVLGDTPADLLYKVDVPYNSGRRGRDPVERSRPCDRVAGTGPDRLSARPDDADVRGAPAGAAPHRCTAWQDLRLIRGVRGRSAKPRYS